MEKKEKEDSVSSVWWAQICLQMEGGQHAN